MIPMLRQFYPMMNLIVPSLAAVSGICNKNFGLLATGFRNSEGISVASLRDSEHGRRMPDAATRAYLTVIEREPEAVQRALAGGRAA